MAQKQIMIIAGEASGDLHGANLARSILLKDKGVALFGVAGPKMAAQGVHPLVDAHRLAVVGISEVLTKLRFIYHALVTVKKALRRKKPDLLILIDFPDFNFLVAAAAKRLDIPILYYISPQIWAWRQNRVKTIRRLVDHMAVIFPFEAPFYRKHRVPVTFVGHPLLDAISAVSIDDAAIADDSAPVIGLVPGSREKEVATLLPVMLKAAVAVQGKLPDARFVISCAPSVSQAMVSAIAVPYAASLAAEIVPGPVRRVFRQSHLLVAASGTVTLEAALHGLPTVIVYKVSPLSFQLGKRLIKVPHIGIVNLIAQKRLLPELIQDDASPRNISRALTDMVRNPDQRNQIRSELLRIRQRLGGPGASDRVAAIALRMMRSSRANP